MHQSKVTIVNGMQRGGTNIVWNLLQSHPEIVSPGRETGELIYPAWTNKRPMRLFRKPLRWLLRLGFRPLFRHVDRVLYRCKMDTLLDPDNRYKNENDLYTHPEVEAAMLSAKSVADDVFFTPALAAHFPESHVISVVRNGLATCEGWVRRGVSPQKAAKHHKKTMDEVLRQDAQLSNHMIVRFEDCLEDPMGLAVKMCRFANLDPDKLKKLRIKAKSIIQQDGSHRASFAQAGQKVWLAPEDAKKFFDPSITQRQIDALSWGIGK